MAIPSLITELSTTAASNPPAGSETTAEGDNHIRQAYAFIAQNYDLKAPKASPTFTGVPAAPTAAADTNTTQLATTAFVIGQAYAKLASPTFTGTVTAAAVTTTGNTILGNASTDTLNVGDGGIIKDASGNVGIGQTPRAGLASANYRLLDIGLAGRTSVYGGEGQTLFSSNVNWSAGSPLYDANGYATVYRQDAGLHVWSTTGSGTAGNAITFSEAARLDASGNFVLTLQGSAPSLAANGQMVFTLTSNTNLRISVRGTDGVTRVTNITLA